MKIQFPEDEIRNHDDRIGKHHNNILRGAVDEDDNFLSGGMKKDLRSQRRMWTQWPRYRKQKLWHPWPQQTEDRGMLAGSSVGPTGVRSGSAASTLGLTMPRQARETRRIDRRNYRTHSHTLTDSVQRICNGSAHRNEHVRKGCL